MSAIDRVVLPNGTAVWMVRSYATARAVLSDSRLSNDVRRMGDRAPQAGLPDEVRRVVQRGMLNTDPPVHTAKRRSIAHAFTVRRVAELRPSISAVADNVVAGLGDRCDLVHEFADPLAMRVLGDLLGIPADECPAVQRAARDFVTRALLSGDPRAPSAQVLLNYATELVQRKAESPGDDLVSHLLAVGEEPVEASSTVIILMIAGHTATSQSIANTLRLMMDHPHVLAAARSDTSVIEKAYEEALRLEPSLRVSAFRCATEPLTIDGTDIAAGDIVLCSLSDVNRDAARFVAPDEFDPDRPDNQHLAFGFGLHRCIGAQLARVQAEIGISTLLSRFDGVELAVPADTLTWTEAGIMRELDSLPVRLTSAKPTTTGRYRHVAVTSGA